MKIGVLAVQGAFAEHIAFLERLEVAAVPVRLPRELEGLDGLILPGGESTSISLLMAEYRLTARIRGLAREGLPVFGTCAGVILMARRTSGFDLEPLGIMDITVRRNAFGRQKESFEAAITVPALGTPPFPAVFIRAPVIEGVNGRAEVLARLADGTIIAVRESRLLAAAFHPELTDDARFHQYFLDIIRGKL